MPESAPQVAIRLVSTTDEDVRRVDVLVGAGESLVVEGETRTPFATERLWPTVRDLLPDVAPLREDPHGSLPPPRRAPDPGLEQASRAFVAVSTVLLGAADTVLAVRGWLSTDTELWRSDARPDGSTDLRPAAPGELADLLVWDVTGALRSALAATGSEVGS